MNSEEISPLSPERRASERRETPRVLDLPLPEARRLLVVTAIFVVVLALFVWMVRDVLIAALLGLIAAAYLRPPFLKLCERIGAPAAAIVAITVVVVPLVAVTAYAYGEIVDVAEEVAENADAIAAEVNRAVSRLPFTREVDAEQAIRRALGRASAYGTRLPGLVAGVAGRLAVSGAFFLFTAFYVLTEGPAIASYVRGTVAPRYRELVATLEANARAVLYGAIYATVLTQTIKSAVLLVLFLLFGVPLAVVLALASFVIGFFPIVGSWSVYVPVAGYLLVFRDSPWQAVAMLAIGFLLNTVFFTLYLRPKIAAERSQVLNFYWMFVGLVTGVYTFGIAGIVLGPILIGLLKAMVDTATSRGRWRLLDEDEEVVLTPPPPR